MNLMKKNLIRLKYKQTQIFLENTWSNNKRIKPRYENIQLIEECTSLKKFLNKLKYNKAFETDLKQNSKRNNKLLL